MSGFPQSAQQPDGADNPPQHNAGAAAGDAQHSPPQSLLLRHRPGLRLSPGLHTTHEGYEAGRTEV